MQIRNYRRVGDDTVTAIPRSLGLDPRLSYEARGLMAAILTHDEGDHVNAESLAGQHDTADHVRAWLRELVDFDYLRMVRRQDGDGNWRTDLNVYPKGDAPEIVGQS